MKQENKKSGEKKNQKDEARSRENNITAFELGFFFFWELEIDKLGVYLLKIRAI